VSKEVAQKIAGFVVAESTRHREFAVQVRKFKGGDFL
jgi:hypothetical protein